MIPCDVCQTKIAVVRLTATDLDGLVLATASYCPDCARARVERPELSLGSLPKSQEYPAWPTGS